MLVFIDESGHPMPNDSAERPVILAVCIDEHKTTHLTRAIYSMKKGLLTSLRLTRAEEELKAVKFLDRRSLLNVSAKREFVDTLFEMLRDFDLTAFGIVMERPDREPYRSSSFLQPQHQWLLERIDRFMERDHPNEMAIPIFDGQDPQSNMQFSDAFTAYMARTDKGRAMRHIVASPLFVDSSLTPGIQIADWFAYVTRLKYKYQLHQSNPRDPYLSAIKRYANIVHQKTVDYDDADGFTYYGIATMSSDRFVYEAPHAQSSSSSALEVVGADVLDVVNSEPNEKPQQ